MSVLVILSLMLSGLPWLQFVPAASALTSTAPNLIANPGFENRLTGWSTTEGTTVYVPDSTIQHHGCCSAKGLEITQGSLGRLYQDVTGTTSTGNQYQISGWIKTSNVVGDAVIGLDYVGGGGWTPPDGSVMEIGRLNGTQDWTYFQSAPFALPRMPSDAQALWFFFDFNMGTGTAWFDDVSLVQVTTLPSYFVTDVPITITNNQPLPTAAPFQQMIRVDSALYSSYESPNLQNVEFFNIDGTVIPSWLESGNSNKALDTIYWLKLVDGIPADSSLTIYMGLATQGANLFDGNYVGEAPQLSATYGQFDNGANVFLLYDNFAGSNLSSSWTTNLPESQTVGNGSYNMNDGLNLGSYPGAPGYVATATSYSTGYAFDSYVTAIGDTDSVGFFNLRGPTPVGLTYSGAFIRTFGGYTYPDQWNADGHGEANYRFAKAVFDEPPPYGYFVDSLGASGVYSVNLLYDQASTQYLNYSEGNSMQPMSAHPPGYPLSAGFVAGISPIKVEWARVRAIPPGGVMPVASSLTSALSSSTIVVGGSVIDSSTLTGVTSDAGGTVTYEYFSGSTCSGSPTAAGSVKVASGAVPSSSAQTFSATGYYSWNAVYSGDENNKGLTSGCERLSVYRIPLLAVIVSCNHASVVVGSATTCNAAVQGPSSKQIGSVAWSSDSPGKFSKLTCTLSKGTCSVKFAPASAGSVVTVAASYQRTPSEPSFTGGFLLTVTQKASKTTVSCTPKSAAAASPTIITCRAKVTGYSPTGTVSWSQTGTGSVSFTSTTCTLSQGTCSVAMTASTRGHAALTATYTGDPNNKGSSRTAALTIRA